MPELFDTEHRYHIGVAGNISSKGRAEMARLVKENYGIDLLWEDLGGFEIVNDDGKVTKRVKNNLKKRLGIKLEPRHISEIGNIAVNNTAEAGEYDLIISQDMDTWDGPFTIRDNGNSGSCFQKGGEYRHCWLAMDDHPDYYVLLLANRDENPYARAWLQDEGDRLIIFNSYGVKLNKMGILLAQALNLRTTQGTLNNANGMYVNSNRVNIIAESPGYQDRVSILCHPDDYDRYRQECYECGYQINTENGHYHYDEGHGEYFCSDCYGICEGCCEPTPNRDLTEGDWIAEDFCDYCLLEHDRPTCGACGSQFGSDDDGAFIAERHWVSRYELRHDRHHYCPDCAGRCVVCEAALPEGNDRCDEHLNVQPELTSVNPPGRSVQDEQAV